METKKLHVDYNTLSHELRIPLTGILGGADLLSRDDLSPTQKEQVALIQESGNRLLVFINKFLNNSKVKTIFINT